MSSESERARDILARSKTVAVVGFSGNTTKAAHTAPMELVKRGFDVIPVNPNVTEVAGIPAVPDLSCIDRPVDLVDIFRPAGDTPEIVRQAIEIGAKAVWLQLGITSLEARSMATEAGLDYVEDQCVAPIASRYDLLPPP